MTENKCGGCTACCRVFGIPELKKPAGNWCSHCVIGSHCKIYEERPQSCRTFECIWLQSQERPGCEMPLELRPDRCKVVLTPCTGTDHVLSGTTLPGSPDAWRRGPIRRFIDSFVRNGGFGVVVGLPNATHPNLNRRQR